MLERIKKNIINVPGKRLAKKFLVLESDDWGTIRMPGKEAYDKLLAKNLVQANDAFSKYDALETDKDLTDLFEVLAKYKDNKQNHPVITANTVVCNPDFDKIKESGYREYHHETFKDTYGATAERASALDLIKQGIGAKVYYPQFHAREHLNVPMWMELLAKKNPDFLYAFDLKCFSIDYKSSVNRRNNLMAAYDYYSPESFATISDSIAEGLRIFEDMFGFKSLSTVAPCYVWDSKIENVFNDNGVRYLQGSRFQHIPMEKSATFKKKFHYSGENNTSRQKYFLRNGLFEPSINHNVDWVNKCLESINIAFTWNKPAIIGTHRINFSGSIFPENREKNLALLDALLKAVLKEWPEVEFVSTVDLAKNY